MLDLDNTLGNRTVAVESWVALFCTRRDLPVGAADIKKPDPRIFRVAAAATESTLDGAWMVGDSAHHDIVGAHALGVKTVWVSRGRPWTDASCQPTATIDDLTQLCSVRQEHT